MKAITALALIWIFASCAQDHNQTQESGEEWTSLWNGKDLSGWHTYLNTPYQLELDSNGNKIQPYGIDNDPLEVIKVVNLENDNVIRISGIAWGMIYTEKSYSNYHLKMKVKWGEDMHTPRENGPRDSGLLYHGFGDPGVDNPWMASQELQIQEGDMGDYWPVGRGVEIDVPSIIGENGYYKYSEGAPMHTFYFADLVQPGLQDSLKKRRVLKSHNAENPHGEWNEVELITLGDSSIHIVNGQVVMRLFNSRKMSGEDPLRSGKIILQSEGAEVFYKNIVIRPIDRIPEPFE